MSLNLWQAIFLELIGGQRYSEHEIYVETPEVCQELVR